MTCKNCQERHAAYQRTVCNTCRSRKWNAKNPIRKAWHNLKRSAKKRNYPFELPYENFYAFAVSTGYDKNRGRTKEAMVIDRINNDQGYTMTNIQVITKSSNSTKYWKEVHEQEWKKFVATESPF